MALCARLSIEMKIDFDSVDIHSAFSSSIALDIDAHAELFGVLLAIELLDFHSSLFHNHKFRASAQLKSKARHSK